MFIESLGFLIRHIAKPQTVSPQFREPKRNEMKNCKFCHSGNIIRTEYDFHDAYKCSACDKAFFEKIAECCRNPVDRYVDDFHNNVPVFIRVQCDNCGGCLNMTKSLKRAEFGEKTKGEFSKERFLEWKLERQSERSEIYNFTEYINYTKSNHYLHRTHLRSEYWKNIRQLVLDRDKGICQSCKTEKAKDVHHLTYKNLGNETIDELISYCRACHEKAHGK